MSFIHLLDAERSREIDPVLDCLTFLAREADRPSSPVLLRAGLALADDGRLPFHQIEPALEQVGMRTESIARRLKGWPSRYCPAVLELTDERAAVLLEVRDRDGLIYAPGVLAALIVNLLAFAMPLFTMNVYDRVIPNKSISTLWVLAVGVMLALALDFTLRVARSRLIDEVGRTLDAKLSQKLFEKVMNLPMAERQGSTGAFARRVSEFEMVRDFFASTTVVLAVDVVFLVLFLGLITILAGWLVLVPIAGIVMMLVAGLSLQKAMGRAALDAQADSSLQHSVLVESIAGAETLKAVRAEGQMLGRWRR